MEARQRGYGHAERADPKGRDVQPGPPPRTLIRAPAPSPYGRLRPFRRWTSIEQVSLAGRARLPVRRTHAGRRRAETAAQLTSISCQRPLPTHRRTPLHYALSRDKHIPSLARGIGQGPRAAPTAAAIGLGLASRWSAGKPGRHQHQPMSRGLVCTCLVGPMVVPQWTGHRSYGGVARAGRWSMCQMRKALPRGARGAIGLCERAGDGGGDA